MKLSNLFKGARESEPMTVTELEQALKEAQQRHQEVREVYEGSHVKSPRSRAARPILEVAELEVRRLETLLGLARVKAAEPAARRRLKLAVTQAMALAEEADAAVVGVESTHRRLIDAIAGLERKLTELVIDNGPALYAAKQQYAQAVAQGDDVAAGKYEQEMRELEGVEQSSARQAEPIRSRIQILSDERDTVLRQLTAAQARADGARKSHDEQLAFAAALDADMAQLAALHAEIQLRAAARGCRALGRTLLDQLEFRVARCPYLTAELEHMPREALRCSGPWVLRAAEAAAARPPSGGPSLTEVMGLSALRDDILRQSAEEIDA